MKLKTTPSAEKVMGDREGREELRERQKERQRESENRQRDREKGCKRHSVWCRDLHLYNVKSVHIMWQCLQRLCIRWDFCTNNDTIKTNAVSDHSSDKNMNKKKKKPKYIS